MNPTATAGRASALQELAEREAAIDRAAERIEELEAESREADQAAQDAVDALEAYYRDVGAGEVEPDPARERQLKAAVEETGADRVMKEGRSRSISDPVEFKAVSQRIESMLAGAREALQQAEREYEAFIRLRFKDLARELRAEGEELVKRYEAEHEAAWTKLRAISEEWADLRARWTPLIERSGLDGRFPEGPLTNRGSALEPPVPSMVLNGEKVRLPH